MHRVGIHARRTTSQTRTLLAAAVLLTLVLVLVLFSQPHPLPVQSVSLPQTPALASESPLQWKQSKEQVSRHLKYWEYVPAIPRKLKTERLVLISV